MVPATTDRAAKARDAFQRRTAVDALDDPRKLGRATRIVRAGLETGRITLADVIESAPPLTGQQIERLRDLLPPASGGLDARAA